MKELIPTVANPLTTNRVGSAVWFLAWPTIVTNVLQTGYGFINMVFVGSLGTEAIAAVGFGSVILFLQFALLLGVSIGTSALVSRFFGANTQVLAMEATKQSILMAIFGSALTALPLIFFAKPLLGLLDAKPEVLPLAAEYINIILYATPVFFVTVVLMSAFRGAGDAKTPLMVTLIQVGLNILGDWLLIFGEGPFPCLGVAGAAYATVISRALGLLLTFWLLSRSRLRDCLRGRWMPIWAWFWRILKIGIPAAAQAVLRTVGLLVYYGIIGHTPEGTAAVAALAIGFQAESLAFMPGMAFSIAATSMVGQNLGAKQPDRARSSGWVSAWQGAVVMTVMGLAFFFFAEPFSSLFNTNPDVIRLAALYLQINAVSEPFLALAMILTGALQGAGQTMIPALITFVSLWVFRLPLAWLLALPLGMGATGGWISMSVTTILGGLLTTAYFKWGKWSKVEV